MPRARLIPSRNANHKSGMESLQAAALACPHGLMIEKRGIVEYANPAYAKLVGFQSAEEVMGRPVSGLTVPKTVAKGDGHGGQEFETLRFEFAHEDARLGLHVVRDVTDRRILESRLLESEKMEALGRLVGGVAHDFNNILTAITLHAELLREKEMVGGTREINEIREAARRGADLVRQLLTFARQHPSAAPHAVSVSQMISSMSAVVEPLIGEDIELVRSFAADHDNVSADPAQLQQVILNLVMNARDAMPKGGRIRILTSEIELNPQEAAKRGAAPGRYVSLVVEDNGCGMDEKVRSRIFEPFFTTKKHGAGTGLGMSMVYGIVNQSGGAVSVTSKVGKGTRVTVLLPHLGASHAASSAEGPAKVEGGNETVLLAEDDSAVRSSIAELLDAGGYRVLQARDGSDAVRIARHYKKPIHLLLSDVVMPRMNGADAAASVRRLHPESKVLFISGYPAKAVTTAASEALLFKPFSRTVLAQRVREALQERRPASKATRSHLAARGTS